MNTATHPTVRAAIYARYSTDLQRDASIEDQVRSCRALLAREGIDNFDTFADRAASGASMVRPGLQALLAAVREGRVEIVVAEGLDRLSRDQADVADIAKRLNYAGVRLLTVQEGEVNELHIGLKGTMNALFLKDLAVKVRRGIEGRVRAGSSGGGLAYGYRVVHGPGPDYQRGGREIVPAEAAIVRRIFEDYAAGVSPRAIAARLNREGRPGPGGKAWAMTTINGNRQRGTGILNNQLYAGRLVWNRQRMVKDPDTGRRRGRPNPPEAWIVEDVPELRIVSEELWESVRTRQAGLTFSRTGAAGAAMVAARRPRTLLSGLMRCGACGGAMVRVSHDRLACARAREGACGNRLRILSPVVERTVVAGVRERLLAPEAYQLFARVYIEEMNRAVMEANTARQAAAGELETVIRQLDRLVDQILDGTPARRLRDRMDQLEARREQLERLIETTPTVTPYIHPNLAARWSERVESLNGAFDAGEPQAQEALRRLIQRVDLTPDNGELRIDLHGELGEMLHFCGLAPPPAPDTRRVLSLVAEERSQRYYPLSFIGLPKVA